MATRATYSFKSQYGAKTTIYIHFDGYPQGAALYFNQMLTSPSKGDLATQFIRANASAEITKSEDSHGDTEFHYEIEGDGPDAILTAYEMPYPDREKKCFYTGKLYEFINTNHNIIDNFKPYKVVQMIYRSRILNEATAKIALQHPLSHLQMWKGKFENSGNWNSCVEELKNIVTEFPDLKTEDVLEFIS